MYAIRSYYAGFVPADHDHARAQLLGPASGGRTQVELAVFEANQVDGAFRRFLQMSGFDQHAAGARFRQQGVIGNLGNAAIVIVV